MEFLIVGVTESSQNEITNKIRKLGGKIVTKINSHLAAVVSNVDTVNNCRGVIKDAFMHRIQVIPDDFINEVIETDPIEVIAKKDLSGWGKDVRLLILRF